MFEDKQWKLTLYHEGFVPIEEISRDDFMPYQKHVIFNDLSYSLLYAWSFKYSYVCREMLGNMVIVGCDIENQPFFTVIPLNYDTFREVTDRTIGILSKFGTPFSMQYVSDSLKEHLSGFEMKYDKDFSDYVYDIHDFVNITGNKNKSKRHEYTYVKKNFVDAHYERVTKSNIDDVFRIFDMWCAGHECGDCVWGCEKKAFQRLMQVYDSRYCIGGIVYFGDKPVSFGIAEKLNSDFFCYHTQKNVSQIRGLTYFLHYYMAMEHLDTPYINWGEDMGLEGLRNNKKKYHPCRMLDKYEIQF